jgi:hypothetical protein
MRKVVYPEKRCRIDIEEQIVSRITLIEIGAFLFGQI